MPLTKKQIEERKNYIGASESAAALGLSRWKTPLQLWAEKTGAVEPDDLSDVLAIEVGTELEDLVCKLFTKRTGKEVRRVNETIYHPEYRFIAANIDRRVVAEDAVLEAKTASQWKVREWEGEEIPQEYVIQVMHQLAVTGRKKGYIAVLIGGNQQFVWKEIHRDEGLVKDIIKKEVRFWNEFVIPKILPAVTAYDRTTLQSLYQYANEKEIALGDDANRLIESLEGLEADAKVLESAIDKEKNGLRAMLGENSFGYTDKYRVSWREQVSQRIDAKKLKQEAPELFDKFSNESNSRVLRIGLIKEK